MLSGLTSNVGPLIGPVIASFSSTAYRRWMFLDQSHDGWTNMASSMDASFACVDSDHGLQ